MGEKPNNKGEKVNDNIYKEIGGAGKFDGEMNIVVVRHHCSCSNSAFYYININEDKMRRSVKASAPSCKKVYCVSDRRIQNFSLEGEGSG
jgi:hypothetical protein